MRDSFKHFPVNWIDGMKINKSHFIAQDNACKDAIHDIAALTLSPVRYGILPATAAGDDTFNVKITADNQNTLRVAVLACNAITCGGVRVVLPALQSSASSETDGIPATTLTFQKTGDDAIYYIALVVNPYNKRPAGSPDLNDDPPRFPYVLPTYTIESVSEYQLGEFLNNPYALIIGKVLVNGYEVAVDGDYIPPCFSVNSHADLISLYADIDKYLGLLEMTCIEIVQNILKKNQQNELSELVKFLCDRVMIFLSESITKLRFTSLYESPATIFVTIASLARLIKNSIDMRIGSGKETVMNYFIKWTELKQGDFENYLTSLATLRYNHNDVNENIEAVRLFVDMTSKLFKTLSKLEFIGELPEKDRIFIKEETTKINGESPSVRRRFFG
jgi:hypothetical protein